MNDELRAFIEAGMGKYGRASLTLVSFGKHLEEMLSDFLRSRSPDQWSPFVPNASPRVKSTRYWSEYPLRNAMIDGQIAGKTARITIAVNWFKADGDYPIYWAQTTVGDTPFDILADFQFKDSISAGPDGLVFEPNPDDFDLTRDFSLLLDETVRALQFRFG